MAALTVLIVLLVTFRFLTTLPPPNLSDLRRNRGRTPTKVRSLRDVFRGERG
jgi:hypothetical protein